MIWGYRPVVYVEFVAVLSDARFIVRFYAGEAQLSVFESGMQFLIFRVVGALSEASGDHHATDPYFLRNFRFFFEGQAAFRLCARVLNRLRRALVHCEERGEE